MDTVPQMISTKDLSYISDMFEWNYTAYKQINGYISNIKQPEIKELLESAQNMHYNHLLYLVSILNGDAYLEVEYDEEEYDEGE